MDVTQIALSIREMIKYMCVYPNVSFVLVNAQYYIVPYIFVIVIVIVSYDMIHFLFCNRV